MRDCGDQAFLAQEGDSTAGGSAGGLQVSAISDSVGMRVLWAARQLDARMIAAICVYGATGPVGSIVVTGRGQLTRHDIGAANRYE